jgi:hypothetical protein
MIYYEIDGKTAGICIHHNPYMNKMNNKAFLI